MPRFYFHVRDGDIFAEDEEGIIMEDCAAARAQAIRGARDIMAAAVQKGELDLGSFVEVEDENGNCVFLVSFADALQVRAPSQAS